MLSTLFVTGGSSESDDKHIKNLTKLSLPGASTIIKRGMPLSNDHGAPVHNANKFCAVVLANGNKTARPSRT